MCEELIIKVLNKSMDFLNQNQIQKLRTILEEELYNYNLQPVVKDLVPINNIREKMLLYLASKKLDGLSKNTLLNYKLQLNRFANFIQKDVESITSMDVRMYLAACSKIGLKNSSMASIISILKSFFNWLEDEEYISKNPMRKIKTIKTEKYIRKALTFEELEMLRDVCKNIRERALLELFYSTGCRLDEIQKLDKKDIDWNTGSTIVLGKGSKERKVYLNAKAKIYLWKYLNSRKDENEALFASERKPYTRLGRRSIEKIFNNLGMQAGITKKVYPHLLRHTTATHMLNNGSSLSIVQNYLGHTSPVTTQIYAQLNTEDIRQSHKKHLA